MDKINLIHKDFFSLRNGILADAVRKAGCGCPRIFGLNVPQLSELGRKYGVDSEMAARLWQEKECRESRLLACWMFDAEAITPEEAMQLVDSLQSVEEADILVFRLLKRVPYAASLIPALEEKDGDALRVYTAKMLRRHLGL